MIQVTQADYQQALESFDKATKPFEGRWRDGNISTVVYYANVLFNVGVCHLALNNNQQAADVIPCARIVMEKRELRI